MRKQQRLDRAWLQAFIDGLGGRPTGMEVGADADTILARQRGRTKGLAVRKGIIEEATEVRR